MPRAACTLDFIVISMRCTSACSMIGACSALFRTSTLAALAGELERLLIGALADPDALRADGEAGRVHHDEHRRQTPVFLADEPGLRAFAFAVDHDAGRRGVDAELVLDAGAAHVIAGPKRAVGVDEEFWREEERKPARSRRGAG